MERHLLLLLISLILGALPANAQTFQFLPEVETYFRVNSRVQFYFGTKETREGGDPTQAEFGPSVEFYLAPWLKLKNHTIFDLNEGKKRALVLSIAYRCLASPDAAAVNRLRLDLTSHFPMKAGILISDRNRVDLDWQSGKFQWRYRNRLTVERRLTIHSYHPAPFVRVEAFYASQYEKWSTTALYVGCLFPFGKRVELEPYYEHQNNTGKNPNRSLDQLGLILDLYFLGTN